MSDTTESIVGFLVLRKIYSNNCKPQLFDFENILNAMFKKKYKSKYLKCLVCNSFNIVHIYFFFLQNTVFCRKKHL